MKKGHILLVEDNEGDILLTQEAFEHSSLVESLRRLPFLSIID